MIVDFDALATSQQNDDELKTLVSNKNNCLNLAAINMPNSKQLIWCSIQNNKSRPFVTKQFRKVVFRYAVQIGLSKKGSSGHQ